MESELHGGERRRGEREGGRQRERRREQWK